MTPPSKETSHSATTLTIDLPAPVLASLDAWIAEQTDRPSREEAVTLILLEWLATAQNRADEDFPERRGGERRRGPGKRAGGAERRKGGRRSDDRTSRAVPPDELNSENDV